MGILLPVYPFSSLKSVIGIPSSLSNEKMIVEPSNVSTGSPNNKSRGVTFNPFTKIVLIPSRIEYKSAKLVEELWWCDSEYELFSQSAYSELRLLSLASNIGMKEARRKLYQPNQDDANTNLVMAATGSSTGGDDYDEYFTSDAADDDDDDDDDGDDYDENGGWPLILSSGRISTEEEEGGIVIRTSFHKVSSLSIIPQSLRHGGSESDVDNGIPKVSSLDCISAAVRGGELNTADIDGAVAVTLISSLTRGKGHLSARPEVSHSDEDAILQLCVPLEKPALLASGPTHSRSWRRGSKKTISSTSIALCSTILVVAFVLIDRYCGAYMSMK